MARGRKRHTSGLRLRINPQQRIRRVIADGVIRNALDAIVQSVPPDRVG